MRLEILLTAKQPHESQPRFGSAVAPGQNTLFYALLCCAIAACIDFGSFHALHNGDSIILSLISLQRWTPFLWEYDRFGMLLPLLATPFRDPLANLVFQSWLGILCGIASIFLLARFMVRQPHWPVVAVIAVAALLLFTPLPIQFQWFLEQQYATSFTLALSALLLLESVRPHDWLSPRFLAALLLVALAHWVNLVIFVPLLPLVAVRYFLEADGTLLCRVTGRPLLRASGLLVFGALSGQIILKLAHIEVNAGFSVFLPVAELPAAWAQFGRSTFTALIRQHSDEAYLFGPAVFGALVLLVLPRLTNNLKSMLPAACALSFASAGYWLLTGASGWVQQNLYVVRYAFPSLLFIAVLLAMLAAAPFMAIRPDRVSPLAMLLAVSLLVAALRAYGVPAALRPREDIDRLFGRATPELLGAHTKVVVGDYWKVWPAVFHANLVGYGLGQREPIYGLTYRGSVTHPFWQSIPPTELRVAALSGDAEASRYLLLLGLCPTRIEQHPSIDLIHIEPCPVRIEARQMSTLVGTREDGALVAAGKTGYLMFGPYLPLAVGKYHVTILGNLDAASGMTVDVAVGLGRRILASSLVAERAGSVRSGDTILARLQIELNEPASDVEVRAFIGERTQVRITKVEIAAEQRVDPVPGSAELLRASPGFEQRAFARALSVDFSLARLQRLAGALVKSGFNAGSAYSEVWIRDFNTFIELSCETQDPRAVREALLTLIRFQGDDGDIPDGYVLRGNLVPGGYWRASPLDSSHLAYKNTVETDQESSLVQAVAKYVTKTGDRALLDEAVGGQTVRSRLSHALEYLLAKRFDSDYGLLWGGTTADWGDVQPESLPGIELDGSSHRAIDVYDNAMFLIAIDALITLDPVVQARWSQTAAQVRVAIRKGLWDPSRSKFIPHLYLEGSPFPAEFDEGTIQFHGGTAVAIEAGLLSREEIAAANARMLDDVRKAGASSIGLTVYPPYPAGSFKNQIMAPYSYQNGGDWPWFGGRMIQALVRNCFTEEALAELRPMVDRVLRDSDFYEWYTLDGKPRGSGSFRGEAGVLWKAIQLLLGWAEAVERGEAPSCAG
jgi:hypothetical protein